jgi:hypothetical protein
MPSMKIIANMTESKKLVKREVMLNSDSSGALNVVLDWYVIAFAMS